VIYRVNDPAEASRIYGEDLTALVSDRRNVCLSNGSDLAIFAWRGPGIYEGHLEFKSRGREAIRVGKAMLAEMRDARMIWGPTPVGLRHVRWFQRQLGFVSHGIMATPEGDCELFVMEGLA
jgi:hypothetical protein